MAPRVRPAWHHLDSFAHLHHRFRRTPSTALSLYCMSQGSQFSVDLHRCLGLCSFQIIGWLAPQRAPSPSRKRQSNCSSLFTLWCPSCIRRGNHKAIEDGGLTERTISKCDLAFSDHSAPREGCKGIRRQSCLVLV